MTSLPLDAIARRRAIVQALVDTAPHVLADYYRPDCCVAATRIGINVLQHFGLAAEPQPVAVHGFNNQMAAHVERGEVDDQRTCEYWTDVDGSWGIGVGYIQTGGPGWDGHLVIRCDRFEAPVLIDLSVAQFTRRQHAMVFEPFAGLLPTSWPTPPVRGVFRFEALGVLVYEPTEDRRYETAPDWRRHDRARPVAGRIIRAMKERL